MNKCYSELIKLETFEERFDYLKLNQKVGDIGFGQNRIVNQNFYMSTEWKNARRKAIIRDGANDLGIDGRSLGNYIVVHHINPITLEDLENADPKLFDLENLICVSSNTHRCIHFGDKSQLANLPQERQPFDTCPWKRR